MRKHSRARLLSGLAVLALVLAACGGDSNEPAATPEPAETPPEEEPAEAAELEEDEQDEQIDYPTSAITMLVPYPPGGSIDAIARLVEPLLSEELGVSVQIANREGGAGSVGTVEMVQANPDGYTIGLSTTSILGLNAVFQDNQPFADPNSYINVAKMGSQAHILVVRADEPYDTMSEWIEFARENPGVLNVGHAGGNSTTHLSAAELAEAADLDVNFVPMSGAEALIALMSDRLDATSSTAGTILGDVEAGNVKVLGVFDDNPHPAFPDAETVADAGYPGVGLQSSPYFIAPAGVDDQIIAVLREAFRNVLQDAELQQRLQDMGLTLDLDAPDDVLETEVASMLESLRVLGLYDG